LVVGGILGGDYIPAFVLRTGWERELRELFGGYGGSIISWVLGSDYRRYSNICSNADYVLSIDS
jgi:hypothetical protein